MQIVHIEFVKEQLSKFYVALCHFNFDLLQLSVVVVV